jgi:predicted phosphoribosyltransferase
VLNPDVLNSGGVTGEELASAEEVACGEVTRRVERLRRGADRVPLAGRTAVLVDDGIATGATARAATRWRGARKRRPGGPWRRGATRVLTPAGGVAPRQGSPGSPRRNQGR